MSIFGTGGGDGNTVGTLALCLEEIKQLENMLLLNIRELSERVTKLEAASQYKQKSCDRTYNCVDKVIPPDTSRDVLIKFPWDDLRIIWVVGWYQHNSWNLYQDKGFSTIKSGEVLGWRELPKE